MRMVGRLDDAVFRLAMYQEGLVSLGQARRMGFTRDQIRHRRASGRWPLAWPGIVRLPGAPVTWHSELMAGWLLLGDRGAVSRSWASALLEMEGVERTPRPEFTVLRGTLDLVGGLRLHSTRRLDPVDLITVRRPLPTAATRDRSLRAAGLITGYRVTTASRTIIDLASTLSDDDLGAMIDSACRAGHTSPAYLARRLDDLRGKGRAGTRRVEDALVDAGGHSMLERRFLRALRAAGLPRPCCQATYRVDGRFLARVDFDFRPAPLVVEVNGRKGHSSDADRAKDGRRRNELQRLGIVVLDFTYHEVLGNPRAAVEEVALHLARWASANR